MGGIGYITAIHADITRNNEPKAGSSADLRACGAGV